MKKFIFTFVLVLAALSASAQYRVDRLVTAGRSALFYEDFVLSIKYFNLAIGAKPYLYEPWYYRSVAKFNLDDYMGACTASCTLAAWFALRQTGRRTAAILFAAMTVTSLIFWFVSRSVITDQPLYFFSGATLFFAYIGLTEGVCRNRNRLRMWKPRGR